MAHLLSIGPYEDSISESCVSSESEVGGMLPGFMVGSSSTGGGVPPGAESATFLGVRSRSVAGV